MKHCIYNATQGGLVEPRDAVILSMNFFLPRQILYGLYKVIFDSAELTYDFHWHPAVVASVVVQEVVVPVATALIMLKGQCHEIFDFRLSTWISFLQAPDYTIRAVSNFFANSQRYSQLKVHHRCRWRRWQLATDISKTSEIGGKTPVSLIPVVYLDLRISPRIFEKIRNGPNGMLWGCGAAWLEADWYFLSEGGLVRLKGCGFKKGCVLLL
jgi:hypothetical protein